MSSRIAKLNWETSRVLVISQSTTVQHSNITREHVQHIANKQLDLYIYTANARCCERMNNHAMHMHSAGNNTCSLNKHKAAADETITTRTKNDRCLQQATVTLFSHNNKHRLKQMTVGMRQFDDTNAATESSIVHTTVDLPTVLLGVVHFHRLEVRRAVKTTDCHQLTIDDGQTDLTRCRSADVFQLASLTVTA